MTDRTKAIVFGARPGDAWRAGRTLRAARAAGLDPAGKVGVPLAELIEALAPGPLVLIRAGAWPVARFSAPPRSATGRPLLALGAVRAPDGPTADAGEWARAYAASGGDFRDGGLPPLVSAFLDERLAAALRAGSCRDLGEVLRAAVIETRARVVHFAALDVQDDDRLRIAEVVTSAQQGGAERLAIDLARGLSERGLSARLVTLGRPTREAFAVPADTLDLQTLSAPDPRRWARRAARRLVAHGFDVVHGHLIESRLVRAISRRGLPLALTIHNTSRGWPRGTRLLRPGDATLLVACARAVEDELSAAGVAPPRRTVWNGVDFDAFVATPERLREARAWRERLGFGPDDFVLLALANPRPQKRAHRLPAILAATREALSAAGVPREARLVVAGAPSAAREDSLRAEERLRKAVERRALGEHVRLVGSVKEITPLLLCADALVSASAYEGLSLAQLEALAAGRPVVATDVGGSREAARGNPACFLVEQEAPAAEFARRLLPIAQGAFASGRDAAAADFHVRRMLDSYARLLPRLACARRRRARADGLWLVTNNFSTGGAQTSARRLLLALRQGGLRVRAAVLQEQPEHPTPGREALQQAGVPVLALPPPEDLEPAAAVERLLLAIDEDPPAAVMLWNVIPEHKLLLADALFDVQVFDVSPGEMYLESLQRYFARPRPGLPYRTLADYGARLAGVVVKYAAEAGRARQLGAPVHVIPNGVPLPEERAPGSGNGRVVMGTLARLDARKHVDRLLRALQLAAPRMPAHVLRIAGGAERGQDAYVDELRRLAGGLSVELVGEAEPAAFLRGLDVFALVAEPAGCPNASLEAMAAGLPVVATDAGGMSEQVEDGVNGRLVGREDVAALADALVEVASDAQKRRRFGEAARARVAERFALDRMVEAYRSLCAG